MRTRQLIFLFLAFTLISATTTQEKILGTWEVYRITGKKKSKKKIPKIQLTFGADETLVIKEFSESGKSKKAKYAYDESTKTLYIEVRSGRDAEAMEIIKITSNKMILAPEKQTSAKSERLYLKKVG